MKNKKRIIITIGLLILLVSLCFLGLKNTGEGKKNIPTIKTKSLMDHEEYKDINVDNIKKIVINKYTEGGLKEEEITTKEGIIKTYSYLRSINLGKKVKTACDDNTTIYEIELTDNNTKKIEIECDWVIIKNIRYKIK